MRKGRKAVPAVLPLLPYLRDRSIIPGNSGGNMHKLAIIALALAGFALSISSATAATVAMKDAASHQGQTVTVEGNVSMVFSTKAGTTFIDMGGDFPDQLFTVVIFPSDAKAMGDEKRFVGKTIDVTGEVKIYKGRPEIIARNPNQIRVH